MLNRFALMAAASSLSLGVAAAADIAGYVTEGSGVLPLEGAIITVKETGRSVATGRDGSFRIANLPAGTYTIEVSYLGADTVTETVVLDSDDDFVDLSITIGEDIAVTDSIVVSGQRGALYAGLNQERSSDTLVEVLSSDAIGQLPDENAAEAIRRGVGTNVLNDQGEGRFVSIRGLDPSLNTTSINGVRMTSPEGDERAVPLDVIDAEVLERIVISKALTPDMDGDGFGGNIEIKTLSGLDQNETLFNVKIGAVYTDQTDAYGEKLSAAYADNFMDGRLGLAGSVSWQSREFGSENKEVDGEWIDVGSEAAYPEELELRDYLVTRERFSISGNADYMVNDNNRIYLTAFFNEFQDDEFRSRVEHKFGDGELVGSNGATAFVDGIEVDRDIKDRTEVQQLFSVIAGHEWTAPFGEVDWSISYAKAEEEEPDRLDSDFQFDENDGQLRGVVAVDGSDRLNPTLAFTGATGLSDLFDASLYAYDSSELTNGLTEDEEFAFTANALKYKDFFGVPGYLKTGVKIRLRESQRDVDLEIYETDLDLTLADFPNMVDYPLDRIGTVPSPTAFRSFFFDNFDDFELEELDTIIESNAADFNGKEDIYAGYLMANLDLGNARLVGGLRVEHTEFEGNGQETFLAEEDATVDGVTLDDDTVFVTPLSNDQSYTDFLPSVSYRRNLSENVIMRLSYFHSVVRPSFPAQIATALVEQNDDDEIVGEIGNPDLDRQKADSFDASVEWYPNKNAVFSAGVFHKEIDDFIAVKVESDFTAFGRTFDEAVRFVNLDGASITGIELNYQQALEFLPAPFDGFIVGANYTGVDSSARVDGRVIELPRQSSNVFNALAGYDKGRFDLRAAVTWRDEFLDEINAVDEGVDRVVLDHIQVDLDAKVKITDQFRVFAGFKNVNDEPFVAVARYQQGDFLQQYEEYGWSARFGIQYKY